MVTVRFGAKKMPLRSSAPTPFLSARATDGASPAAQLKLLPQSPRVRTSTTRTSGSRCSIWCTPVLPRRSSNGLR